MAAPPLSVCVDGYMEAGRALRDSVLLNFLRLIDHVVERMVCLHTVSCKALVGEDISCVPRSVRDPPDCGQQAKGCQQDIDLLALYAPYAKHYCTSWD